MSKSVWPYFYLRLPSPVQSQRKAPWAHVWKEKAIVRWIQSEQRMQPTRRRAKFKQRHKRQRDKKIREHRSVIADADIIRQTKRTLLFMTYKTRYMTAVYFLPLHPTCSAGRGENTSDANNPLLVLHAQNSSIMLSATVVFPAFERSASAKSLVFPTEQRRAQLGNICGHWIW